MTYFTGSANNMTDLLNAIVDQADAAGWTTSSPDGSNSLISTAGAAFKLTVNADGLAIHGGLTVSGSSLTTPALAGADPLIIGVSYQDYIPAYPMLYRIFTYDDPKMVVVAVQVSGGHWSYMMFGLGINRGVPGNAGAVPFYYANMVSDFHRYVTVKQNVGSNFSQAGGGNHDGAIFGHVNSDGGANDENAFAYVNVPAGFLRPDDPIASAAVGWSGGLSGSQVVGSYFTLPYLTRSPNTWNGVAHLIPIICMMRRPNGLYSEVFEIPHIRMLRNTYYNDGDIRTEGTDQWMIQSVSVKNADQPDAYSIYTNHGGTFGYAFPYEAP